MQEAVLYPLSATHAPALSNLHINHIKLISNTEHEYHVELEYANRSNKPVTILSRKFIMIPDITPQASHSHEQALFKSGAVAMLDVIHELIAHREYIDNPRSMTKLEPTAGRNDITY